MSKNNWKIIWVSVASAVLGAFSVLLFLETSYELQSRNQMSPSVPSQKPPKPKWKSISSQQDSSKEAENSINTDQPMNSGYPTPSLENPPQTKQVREEAASNVHGTPRALLDFAEQLAKSMEGAFAEQETRYNVSRQLMACARDSQSRGAAQAARALCLANLERLKNKFPEELAPSYQSLIAELPEDLLIVAGVQKTSEEK